MTYKTILLHLDATGRCAARVEQGIALAGAFDAHLVGLAVLPPLIVPGTAAVEMAVELLYEQWESDKRDLTAAAEGFSGKARAAGVAKVESRFVIGDPEQQLALHARYADLVIIGQTPAEESGVAETLVLDAGRPVLILPQSPAASAFGRRVLVGWNASREATRALTDALPLLQRAVQVDVVTVNARPERAGHGELPGADIALFLSRHGVRANVIPTYGEDIEVGEWLLSRASDLGSDLIVMGAYGHSRVREWVLGGATRTLLQSMTVPVLMSH